MPDNSAYWLKTVSLMVRQAHFSSCITWGKLLTLSKPVPLIFENDKKDQNIVLSHKITVKIKWENACKCFVQSGTQEN